MIDYSALIITYNSRRDIVGLVRDIRRTPAEQRPPITIIDNNSIDGTPGVIQERFPDVRLIANAENIGFTRAVNQGFDICDTKYVFLLNPDVRLSSPGFFPRMLRCIQASPKVAAVGPLQFQKSGRRLRLNLTWSFWSPKAFRLFVHHNLTGRIPYQQPIPTPFLNAGCLLLRRDAFLKVGKINEKYFMYGEEPDLFLKFKRHGFDCRLHPGVSVIHYREGSIKTLSWTARARLRLDASRNIADALLHGYLKLLIAEFRRR